MRNSVPASKLIESYEQGKAERRWWRFRIPGTRLEQQGDSQGEHRRRNDRLSITYSSFSIGIGHDEHLKTHEGCATCT